MLIVRVDMHSGITGKKWNLGTIVIANDGTGTHTKGNYWTKAYRKGVDIYKAHGTKGIIRTGEVKGYSRVSKPVWNLVAKALKDLGYS